MNTGIYDVSHKIPKYTQTDPRWSGQPFGGSTIGSVGCSLTSAAMCVNRTPLELCEAGFNAGIFDWQSVAAYCGMRYSYSENAALDRIAELLMEHPVLVGVSSSASPAGTHFVVAYRFSGRAGAGPAEGPLTGVRADMIYAFDPIRGEITLAHPGIQRINTTRIFT